MRVKNAMKRVAALGAGAAMLGATVLGAAAYDLGDYPQPFVMDGTFGGKLVLGANADTADLIGALDIAASLQRAATTPVEISTSTVTVSDGDTEEIALGSAIVGSGGLESEYLDTDMSVLQDTSVDINGTEINIHDEIQLGSNLQVVTSLSTNDKDYETDVALELQKDDLKYCYEFDEAINLSNHVSSDLPLEIDFLGQNLKITNIASATSLTAEVGTVLYLDAGASAVVSGKTVTLDRTTTSSAKVTVDGDTEVISEGQILSVGGLRVKVDTVFDDEGIEFDFATLVVGEDASKTYSNGNAFIGEDEDDPDWVWSLANLTATTSQILCVENDFQIIDEGKDPARVGEYYTFPNEFAKVGIDSLTVADDQYLKLDFVIETEDLSDGGGPASDTVLKISSSEDESLVLDYSGLNDQSISADTKTSTIYVDLTSTAGKLGLYYDDPNNANTIAHAGNITDHTNSNLSTFAYVDYGKTKDTDVTLKLFGGNATDTYYVGLVPLNSLVSSDAFWLNLSDASNNFDGFGTILTEEGADVRYGNASGPLGDVADKGTLDESLRNKYGIWADDLKAGTASDEFSFWVPSDQVKANAVIASGDSSVGGGSQGTYDDINPIGVGMGILDEDANLGGATPYIVVGGPCVNTVAAELMGNPASCADGFEEGKAKVKWFGDQNALLVAGYSAQDTVGASRVVAMYEDYPEGFAMDQNEFEVLIPTLTDLQVRTV